MNSKFMTRFITALYALLTVANSMCIGIHLYVLMFFGFAFANVGALILAVLGAVCCGIYSFIRIKDGKY